MSEVSILRYFMSVKKINVTQNGDILRFFFNLVMKQNIEFDSN